MPDRKVSATAITRTSAVQPPLASARDLREHRQARRHNERLVAEWLRRLSARRS